MSDWKAEQPALVADKTTLLTELDKLKSEIENTETLKKFALTESVGTVFGDYCVTAQPQTFARRNSDGSVAGSGIFMSLAPLSRAVSGLEKEMTLNSASSLRAGIIRSVVKNVLTT